MKMICPLHEVLFYAFPLGKHTAEIIFCCGIRLQFENIFVHFDSFLKIFLIHRHLCCNQHGLDNILGSQICLRFRIGLRLIIFLAEKIAEKSHSVTCPFMRILKYVTICAFHFV